MKRWKRILCALLCALCLLPLTACHGSRGYDDFVMPEGFDSSREYEISFWAKNDTNKTQTEIYQKAIADFEALYPNIHVSMRLYTDYGKIYNDVITNIATGTTPNVCITYPDHIATYMTGTARPRTRSFPSSSLSAPSAARPTRCPSCARPRHAISTKRCSGRWATRCRRC